MHIMDHTGACDSCPTALLPVDLHFDTPTLPVYTLSPMNLEKQLQKKAMQLEREAKILKENGPQKLLAKRKQLQKELKQLEAEIQRVFAKLKIPLSPETPAARTPRASRPAKGRMGGSSGCNDAGPGGDCWRLMWSLEVAGFSRVHRQQHVTASCWWAEPVTHAGDYEVLIRLAANSANRLSWD